MEFLSTRDDLRGDVDNSVVGGLDLSTFTHAVLTMRYNDSTVLP